MKNVSNKQFSKKSDLALDSKVYNNSIHIGIKGLGTGFDQ